MTQTIEQSVASRSFDQARADAFVGKVVGRMMPLRPASVRTPGLAFWRIRRALTQKELSEAAGADILTVQSLERGGPGQLSTVRKLAEVLNVAADRLQRWPPAAQ